jgi:hypothetical protein
LLNPSGFRDFGVEDSSVVATVTDKHRKSHSHDERPYAKKVASMGLYWICGVAGAARSNVRATAGVHEQPGQHARRPRGRLSDRDSVAGRRARHGHGLHQRLHLVRRGGAQLARLGLRGPSQLSVSRWQCTDPDLRNHDRFAYRDVFYRFVLGQLLPRPSLV